MVFYGPENQREIPNSAETPRGRASLTARRDDGAASAARRGVERVIGAQAPGFPVALLVLACDGAKDDPAHLVGRAAAEAKRGLKPLGSELARVQRAPQRV